MVCCNLLSTMHLTNFSTIKIKLEIASFGFEKITYISQMFESINMHLSQKKSNHKLFSNNLSASLLYFKQRYRYSSDLVGSF